MWYDAFANNGSCGDMDFDEEFKVVPMWEQLGKIIDSESIREEAELWKKHKAIRSVVTDDGDEMIVNHREANTIKEALLQIPSRDRLELFKEIQTTAGLKQILDTIRAK